MPCSLKAYENAEEKELKMEDPNSLKTWYRNFHKQCRQDHVSIVLQHGHVVLAQKSFKVHQRRCRQSDSRDAGSGIGNYFECDSMGTRRIELWRVGKRRLVELVGSSLQFSMYTELRKMLLLMMSMVPGPWHSFVLQFPSVSSRA
jgi:hypothetical protein